MRIHNRLGLLHECLLRWKNAPNSREFDEQYAVPMRETVGDWFEDFHPFLKQLDWDRYRSEAMGLDPEREEKRVRKHIRDVEKLFEIELEGELILFGAFTSMDGYARFEEGCHRVFLGVDESHARGNYLDILETHELAHVARESRHEVWEGFGLSARMTNAEFTNHLPVIEHVFGEGFSCAVSEILVPGEKLWNYAYQTPESLRFVEKHGPSLDEVIHREIQDANGDYGTLYSPGSYRPRQPSFAHYVWAWQWAKDLIRRRGGGDPKNLLRTCSKDWIQDALEFSLTRIS